ncbi:hypothetical protein Q0590_34390 [Rhodocytophaga aerolata]|uniref:DUF4870 domain-containing protein n=1 Tax=Rhodocytophaga aerolata TaxID=455078 RepID=A0ABT8RH34_9BACT|nr:hypothetical protein [Rhodocytophaga aerolata]MDO1451415.1 hypothetical protein [Rhodocytophaga aerolata]
MNKFETAGARTSLLIGLPFGLTAVIVGFLFPAAVTGEGLFTMGYILVNGYATIGLLISFVIMLWVAGKQLGKDIENHKGTFNTTLKFSFVINLTIWSVFILVHLLTNRTIDTFFGFLLPMGLGFISIILTPFTIGLLIYKVTLRRIGGFRVTDV